MYDKIHSKDYDIQQASERCKTRHYWYIDNGVDCSDFDFNWTPVPWESKFVHIFPSKWQPDGGIRLVNKEYPNGEVKFNKERRVTRVSIDYKWILDPSTDYDDFDFSWHPNSFDGSWTYAFPSQWQRDGGTHYITDRLAPRKYVTDQTTKRINDLRYWTIPDNIDRDSFDFSWHPDPDQGSYKYVFGTQWQKDGGPTYRVMPDPPLKYCDDQRAKAIPNMRNWHITPTGTDDSSFDFSWHPEEAQKDYKHIFGTQWQRTSPVYYYSGSTSDPKENYVSDQRVTMKSNTLPRYTIETTLEDLIESHPEERFWALNAEMEYDKFDFSWHPDLSQMDYVHVFGSQWQKHSQTYYVNAPAYLGGNTHLNFVGDQKVTANSTLDIFYMDRGAEGSKERFDSLALRHSQTLKTRYFGNTLDTLLRCAKKCKTKRFWAVSSENSYGDFNFDWHCEPWQNGMLHVFGSKWNKWSNTFLVNAEDFIRTFDWADKIEDVYNLNFVEDQLVTTLDDLNDIIFLDFGNSGAEEAYETVYSKHPRVKRIRFFDNYLDTFKRIMVKADTDYFWVTSSICDYTQFDFSWQPEPWQDTMLHTFQSGEQKFGDTFYVNKAHAEEQLKDIKLLDWYDKVNYCNEQIVTRTEWPEVIYDIDLVTAIKEHTFESPYVAFKHRSMAEYKTNYDPSVWRSEDRSLHVLSQSGSVSVVPKDCKEQISRQVYDYPYILRHEGIYMPDKPQDIVFISYDEPLAVKRWYTLKEKYPRAKWCKNIKGQTKAYHTAAEMSDTDYFYAVFPKIEIVDTFNFDIQPDWLKNPCHYIFDCHNTVIDLTYGHDGVILYNKQLVLETIEHGLDFTLSAKHDVIQELSAISRLEDTPLLSWRTSFREVIKLLHQKDTTPTVESNYRLKKWCTLGQGKYSEWVYNGAQDAIEFYQSGKLEDSYNFDWLTDFFNNKYETRL